MGPVSLLLSVAVRVLVTGISGFVGHHLAALLRGEGHDVWGLVLSSDEVIPEGVTTIPGDVTDLAAVRAAFATARPEGVVHLAGASSVGASFADPIGTWRVNLDGTLSVLEAARGLDVVPRIVTITSGEVYGQVPVDELPVRIDTPMNPDSPYGASKAAADLAATQYALSFDVPVLRVRAFNHIGPGQDARFVVPSIARQLALAEVRGDDRATLELGNLSTRRDFTDVRDMVRAYLRILEAGDPSTPYLACSGASRPIQSLVDTLVACSPLTVEITQDAGRVRSGEQPDLYGSPDALEALGWTPTIPIEQTLSDTLAWWRERVTTEGA